MRKDFIQIKGEDFVLNGEKITLKGFSIGNWMNLEHFMIGFPGTAEQIQAAFSEVYGAEKSKIFWDKYVKNYLTEDDFIYLKSMGINSVRLPFNYHYFMDDLNPNEWKEDGFELLDNVISLCEKYEIYAILDMHSVPGSQNTDWHSDNPSGQALFWKYRVFQYQATALWKHIAEHYAGNKYVCGYDILNEPNYGLNADEFNRWYDETIAAIREVDKDHIIFLEGDDYGRGFELFHEPTDEQTTYALHFYPFVINHDVLGTDMSEEERWNVFDEIFSRQLRARERFHRPLWCGEAGLELDPEHPELYIEMMNYIFKLCKKYDVSWSLWSYKDARTMSIVMPKKDSKWIALKEKIRKAWGDNHVEQERSEATLNYALSFFEDKYSEFDYYDTEFRMRSIFHRLANTIILKEELKNIPWDEMITYPDDFLFENCDTPAEIAEAIRSF